MGAWRVRRRFLGATVAFCMGTIAYVLHYRLRGPVAETTIMMSFGTMGSLVIGYVLGATMDDRYTRQFGGRRNRGRNHHHGSQGGFDW